MESLWHPNSTMSKLWRFQMHRHRRRIQRNRMRRPHVRRDALLKFPMQGVSGLPLPSAY